MKQISLNLYDYSWLINLYDLNSNFLNNDFNSGSKFQNILSILIPIKEVN